MRFHPLNPDPTDVELVHECRSRLTRSTAGKSKLSPTEIATLEAMIGDCLEEFDHPLVTEGQCHMRLGPTFRLMRNLYPGFFSLKVFLRSTTAVGRLVKRIRTELID